MFQLRSHLQKLRHAFHSAWIACAFMLGFSHTLRRRVIPMRILFDKLPPTTEGLPPLIVMLPGVYNLPEDFVTHGFVSDLRQHDILADIAMVDIHFGYFIDRTAVQRIHDDVIAPARAQGYRDIWLFGISLGGFGALAYASQYADQINGIFVIAPFPGTGDILSEIRSFGGPLPWSQTAASEQGHERVIWRWLAAQHRSAAPHPPVYFGAGRADRYISAQRMLAELLPADHCHYVEGGHDWAAWKTLWQAFLNRRPLPLHSPCVSSQTPL